MQTTDLMPRIWCLLAFLELNSYNVVQEEFTDHKKVFNMEYASLSINWKSKNKDVFAIALHLLEQATINVRANMGKVKSQDSNTDASAMPWYLLNHVKISVLQSQKIILWRILMNWCSFSRMNHLRRKETL